MPCACHVRQSGVPRLLLAAWGALSPRQVVDEGRLVFLHHGVHNTRDTDIHVPHVGSDDGFRSTVERGKKRSPETAQCSGNQNHASSFAGLPAHVSPAGTSFTTTAPIPIRALAPT